MRAWLNLYEFSLNAPTQGEEDGRGWGISAKGGLEDVLTTKHHVTELSPLPPLATIGPAPTRAVPETLLAAVAPAPGAGLAVATVATVGALGLLAVALKLFLLPLFTRLRRDRLLDDPVRARLHALVRADPGIHLAALVVASGVGDGATRHHLAQLVKARLLVEERSPGFTRYFAAGDVPPDAARRIAALRSPSTARVHEVLSREPGLPLREIAQRVGRSAPSVHRDVKRLREAGLLPPRSR